MIKTVAGIVIITIVGISLYCAARVALYILLRVLERLERLWGGVFFLWLAGCEFAQGNGWLLQHEVKRIRPNGPWP